MARRNPPAPRYNALVASAAVMASRPEGLSRSSKSAAWQDDAWRFYDEVGELRFGIGWLANGMSRVNLVAARQPEQQGDEPSAILTPDDEDTEAVPLTADEQLAIDLVASIAGGADGQGQMLAACAIQLSVPGIGYILMEAEPTPLDQYVPPANPDATPVPDETWTWRVLSANELRPQGDVYEVATGTNEWRPVADDHVLVKVWRPHPRYSWQPDSPCRAVIGILRQIVLLDDHVQATATSRLAGAGILILPTEVEFAPLPMRGQQQQPATPEGPDAEGVDDFSEVLTDTMTLPIGDRGTAAAVVPLTVQVPGEFVDKVRHLTFWSEFSEQVLPLREADVKRLALGLDMPPEVLTGVSGMNHWGAWQVEEQAVTLHIEPMSETVCHALTLGFFRPALRAAGVQDPDSFMVWYDTTDLTTRPDRSADAVAAYDRIELSGAALRRETGLSEDDAPDADEVRERRMWELAKTDPVVAQQLLDIAVSTAAPGTPAEPTTTPDEQGEPDTDGDEPADDEPTGIAASAFLEACDGLVFRALEKAGTRLRSAAGKKVNGGAAAVDCPDPTLLHTTLMPTDYARLDDLLAGAWDRAPAIADRHGIEPSILTAALDNYCRALLATGHVHDSHRLADALGLVALTAV